MGNVKKLFRYLTPLLALPLIYSLGAVINQIFVNKLGNAAVAGVGTGERAIGFLTSNGLGRTLLPLAAVIGTALLQERGRGAAAKKLYVILFIVNSALIGLPLFLCAAISTPFMRLMGGGEEYVALASAYSRAFAISALLVAMLPCLIAQLVKRYSMILTLLVCGMMGLLPLFLSPLFMFVLHIGVAGVGITSGLSYGMTCVAPFLMIPIGKVSRDFEPVSAQRSTGDMSVGVLARYLTPVLALPRLPLVPLLGTLASLVYARVMGTAFLAAISSATTIVRALTAVGFSFTGIIALAVSALCMEKRRFRAARKAHFALFIVFCAQLFIMAALLVARPGWLLRLYGTPGGLIGPSAGYMRAFGLTALLLSAGAALAGQLTDRYSMKLTLIVCGGVILLSALLSFAIHSVPFLGLLEGMNFAATQAAPFLLIPIRRFNRAPALPKAELPREEQ